MRRKASRGCVRQYLRNDDARLEPSCLGKLYEVFLLRAVGNHTDHIVVCFIACRHGGCGSRAVGNAVV